ncbi:hypothetical protein [Roseinatronobacter sp.]|uniref:hypothetical protein n=1 Tax=Roseinatronobacter sp. TaxID=1945755 RepID=UPI0025FFBE68|nr:hypothetical protein [Roseibaca sp.]
MTEPSALFDNAPLRLMRPDSLAGELWNVAMACGTTKYPTPLPKDDEWASIIQVLLPNSVEEIGTAAWLAQWDERQRAALGLQAATIYRRIGHFAEHHWDGLPPPEWVLAPYEWRARMLAILGTGSIPATWVRLTD